MSIIRLLRSSALTLAIAAVATAPLLAQSPSAKEVAALKSKLADLDVQEQKLAREIEFTRYKRESTASKLQQTLLDAQEKELALETLKASAGETPSEAQGEIIANEEQRIELAALNVKSLTASLERLERKEAELRESLAALESQKQNTNQNIARVQERARTQAVAHAKAIEAELAALKEENERLRLAMEAQAQQAAAARESIAQAELETASAPDNDQTTTQANAEQVPYTSDDSAMDNYAAAIGEAFSTRRYAIDTGNEPNPPEPPPAAEPIDNAQSIAQTIEDEPPVHVGDDGPQVIIRSRSIDEPVVMRAVGDNVFEAEVAVEPGRAYFDVRKRRFRGYFPDADQPQTFVFRYDGRGEDPMFTVHAKDREDGTQGEQDPQMISDSGSPF